MIRPKRGIIPSLEWRRFKSSGRPPPATRRPQQQQQQQQKGNPPSNNPAPAPAPAPSTGRTISKECKSPAATKRKRTTGPEKPSQGQGDTLLAVWKTSWLPLSGAAILAGFLGFYVVGTATASFCGGPPACSRAAPDDDDEVPTGRPPALTGDNAEQFDKELDWGEWWMGITKLRRRLAERARGDVLEVAMGSGRNLEYYNWDALTAAVDAVAAANNESGKGEGEDEVGKKKKRAVPAARKALGGITSFTGLDISVDMLDVARRKLTRAVPPMASSAPVVRASTMGDNTGGQLSYLGSHLRLVHSDAHRALPPAATATATAASKKYDTVVQTFGLCSVSDPVAVLSNIATAVKPDTGRIILLEHGKGWFGLVNGLLDRHAGRHFQKYGCWWNRDIRGLVEAAAQRTPGLEIVKIERPNVSQMGTLVWVELKVSGSQG
ncbi:hypothetical protein N3K66_004832 [Trichothecium roseum]|uniref:Uncharacterized protein n=1 Tax=Trichothecium roseum TaxID=47278 RepID=A0ACC0V2E6_9HYPO|nr:hypothetical protein N3K66_004832 [Trichothecium roseum]